jgi:tripartite-type tricarboxylate transporter receptor subunit TctC
MAFGRNHRAHFVSAIALSLVAAIAAVSPAAAQTKYPSRAVTLISPQSAGTTLDAIARLFADRLSAKLGASFVVSNRPGAGGLIAAQAVMNAEPDGYTLALANSGLAILSALNKKLPFDPVQDFTGIAMFGETPALVVVSPGLGVRTLREFVDLAKSKPGKLSYNSAGIGSATHIAGAYFAHQAGVDLQHIPYRSGSEGIADTIAGRVDALFAPAAFVLPLLREGKLLALGVSSTTPITEPIAVPSARSAGVDYVYSTWYGLLAPAKTPRDVIEILSRAIAEISKEPDVQEKLKAQGITPDLKITKDFDAYIRNDMARLKPVLDAIASLKEQN